MGVVGKKGAWLAAGLAAAAAAASYAVYRRDLAAARARLAGSSVLATPCGPIEYAVAGEGPPVLVVHGAGGGFDQGLALAAPLVGHGFRVVAMSRFGYLRTPLPADASAAAQADAHACLLDALGIRDVVVIGASAGAPSALELAIRHPQRVAKLVLLVPAAYTPRPQGEPPVRVPPGLAMVFDTALNSDFVFWAMLRAVPDLMTRTALGTPTDVVAAASPAERERIAAMLRSILPVRPRRLGLLNDGEVTRHLTRCELERIAAPTLAISAADDLYGTYDGARYTAQQIPGARFVGYPSGGHMLVGRQDAVTAELLGFLRDSQGAGDSG
ncbi:MAG TPA: alpha/beta hydrolase [Gammaproteobacteria bacterium]|nr:alpha/beta hydrolase [Gammaproteobacteria bacterium]